MDTVQSLALQDRPTILLIEHEPTRSGLLIEALEREGFAVARAAELSEALRQARMREPDLIILDPCPSASVSRVLERLRSHPATRGRPLVVLRRLGAPIDARGVYAWPAGPVYVDVVLDHVWRVVKTHVLGALNSPEQRDPRNGQDCA